MIRFCALVLALTITFVGLLNPPVPACCPAGPKDKPVVNADQTVILLWDAANKMEHFIRRASFKSDADDFGFLIPTPTQPDLQESGNDAFATLLKLTEPEVQTILEASWACGIGCSKKSEMTKSEMKLESVTVLEQKQVAGFHAAVLAATSAEALVGWLLSNGYYYSPQIQEWAKPYVDQNWKFTALKVSKDQGGKASKDLTTKSLRISFKTDTPLFPYREPDPESLAKDLGARHRLLRIYFIGDARYKEDHGQSIWPGNVDWAGKISPQDRSQILAALKLPETTGPSDWHLTEFVNDWPYRSAPTDLYFTRADNQSDVRRPPIIKHIYWPIDITMVALAAVILFLVVIQLRRGRSSSGDGTRHGSPPY